MNRKRVEIEEAVKKIELIVMDVDGVLTDGGLFYDREGHELKQFNAMDGAGMVYAHRAGLKIVLVSGNFSHSVEKRAQVTRVADLYQNVHDKNEILDEIKKKFSVDPDQICYVGDDLVDIPVMSKIGFPVAVANAVEEVKNIAWYITEKNGGNGAVRELIELILKIQEKWESILSRYH